MLHKSHYFLNPSISDFHHPREKPGAHEVVTHHTVLPSPGLPLTCCPCLWICLWGTFHISECYKTVAFSMWLLSHKNPFSIGSFIKRVSVSISFCLNNISLHGWTSFCLSVYSGWTSALFLMGLLQCCYECCYTFLVFDHCSFQAYTLRRFLGQMVDSTFKLLRKCQLFSTLTRPFYVPTINICGFQFLQTCGCCYFPLKLQKKFGCEEISRHTSIMFME